MPQIPGLPIDEPVALPHASPRQFGSVGEAIYEAGEETQQLAAANLAFEGHLIKAQRYLKAKEAEIAYDRVLNQVHADLAKTTTPEDAQAVYDHAKGELAHTLAPYEHDKVLGRQLAIFGAQQDVELQNTVNGRKATLIQKGDEAATKVTYDKKVQEGINATMAGGNADQAYDQLKMSTDASVHVMGTMLPQQQEAILHKFKQDVTAGVLDANINSPNPLTRRQVIDQLKTGKGPLDLSTLDQGEINKFLTHAAETDKRLTLLAETENINVNLNNLHEVFKSAPYSDSAGNPNFDNQLASLKDPDFLMAHGIVTTDPSTGKPIADFVQGEKLRSYINASQTDFYGEARKKADEERDEIYDLFAQGKIGAGLALARRYVPDFQKARVDYYPQIVNGAKSWEAEQRAEARFARAEKRDADIDKQRAAEEKGYTTSDRLFERITNGEELDFNRDIESEVHKGNLTNKQAHELWYDYKRSVDNPDYQNGLGIIGSSGLDPVEKAKTAAEFRREYRQGGLTGNQVADKAKELVDGGKKKSTNGLIDKLWNFFVVQPAGLGSTSTSAGKAPTATPSKIYARDPQGNLHEAAPGTPLPSGWKLEGQ